MRHDYCQSVAARSAAERTTLDRIDDSIRNVALSFGACEVQYPALIARAALEDADYPRAFPHLLISASRSIDTSDASRSSTLDHEPTEWCLSPAVCYHTYAQLAGQALGAPATFTARGRCFRYEAECVPGVRQVEFEMREIVFIGTGRWVDAAAYAARERVESVARQMKLAGDWQTASDPFFLPRNEGKALVQRLLNVKVEYQSSDLGHLALASVNRHGAFFGRRFNITVSGEPAHTACVAIGLDRWLHGVTCHRRNEEELHVRVDSTPR